MINTRNLTMNSQKQSKLFFFYKQDPKYNNNQTQVTTQQQEYSETHKYLDRFRDPSNHKPKSSSLNHH
jgi:hypothetical protein